MANNDIEIKVVVDAKGAVSVLNEVGEEIKRVESATSDGERGFSKFQAAIVTVNQTIELAKNAFSAMTGAVNTVFGALERGSTVGDIAESFGQLSAKAGAVSDVFLGELQQATAGTVSNFDLMRKSNELLNAGLKPDAIITFSKAARAFGEQDGKSFDETLQGITDSVLRGNDRFLKSKGIILDLTKAYDEYAASVGKTTAEITESERAEIARTLAINALNKKLKETGEIQVDTGDAIAQIRTVFVNAYDDMTKAIAGDKGTLKFLKEFAQGLRVIIPEAVSIATSSLNTLTRILEGTDDAFNNGLKVIGNWANNFVISGGYLRSFDLAVEQTRRELEQQKKTIDLSSAGLADLTVSLGLATGAASKTEKQIESTTASIKDAAGAVGKLNEKLIETPTILAARRIGDADTGGSFWDSITQSLIGNIGNGDGQQSLSDAMEASVSDALSAALQSLSNGGKFDRKAAGSIGASLGKPFGLVGQLAGQYLFEGIYSGIGRIFGAGTDKQTEARKAADAFFADIFSANRLSVVIDGQLKQIEDLVFGNDSGIFSDGSFDDSFHGLEDAARQAFAGVGLAFEELVGGMDEQSGQLAAVIVNNIGGSLNNLQLFVQATGKSFEDLRGTIVEAFLDGKISALEAQSALLGIAQIAQKGIPDGIGFTVQAMENFFAAGAKGGRAVIDGLGDIGAELLELSIKDFPAAQAHLAASGKFTADQINKVFEALQANGINSVEALTDATAEQLIPVLSQLQAEGFLTEAAQEVGDIVTTLERLPARKDVEINLRVNASAADRQILSQVSDGRVGGGGEGIALSR